MNENFLKLLKNLDLTNYQIKIYYSVLKNGMSTVLEIAKDTKLNRSQIYIDAPILVEKGLFEVGSRRNRRYIAVNPRRLTDLVEQKEGKLQELKSLLAPVGDFFEKRQSLKDDDFDIKIYEGIAQVKKVFEFELADCSGAEVLSLVGDFNYQHNFFTEKYWDGWGRRFKKNKSVGKIIVDSHNLGFETYKNRLAEYSWEVRGVPVFSIRSNIDIWRDKILIVSVSKNPKAILIRNKTLAESYTDIFKKMWSLTN